MLAGCPGALSLSSWAVALILTVAIVGATGVGLVAGRHLRNREDTLREPFVVLQAATLGIVGLLLAFGLTLAIGRYETRRAATRRTQALRASTWTASTRRSISSRCAGAGP